MRKKRLTLGITFVIGAVLIAAWLVITHDDTNRAKYQQIRLGMRQAELEELMGSAGGRWREFAEAGDRNNGLDEALIQGVHKEAPKVHYWDWKGDLDWTMLEVSNPRGRGIWCWRDSSGGIAVRIDEAGIVTDKLFEFPEEPVGVWELLRRKVQDMIGR